MARNPVDIPPEQPLFDPNFFNLEYFFNLFFRILDFFSALIAYLLGLNLADLSLLAKILLVLALVFALGIAYSFYKYWKVREEEEEVQFEIDFKTLENIDHTDRNERWQKVLEYMASPTEAEWRLAILEADTILGNLLLRMQYSGETIGDRLKNIEPSDFLTLSEAWEAHKIRNQIAHGGSSFELTRREADRVIDLYRQVFEEFHYI